MPRTIRTKVYKFEELSEQAKEKAIEWYRNSDNDFCWSDEILETVKTALKHFDCKLSDWSIDWDNINRSSWSIKFEFNYEDEVKELNGARLFKYIQNNYLKYYDKYKKEYRTDLLSGNCPFTGVCYDESFLDPIRKFMKKPDSTTFEELIEDATRSAFSDGCDEWEAQQTDEYITEQITANEYEFLVTGKKF